MFHAAAGKRSIMYCSSNVKSLRQTPTIVLDNNVSDKPVTLCDHITIRPGFSRRRRTPIVFD